MCNNALPVRIRLWRLVMRQSPEEGLSEALEALEVFDRPVPPVSEEVWAEINRLIAQRLTRPDPGKKGRVPTLGVGGRARSPRRSAARGRW